MRGLCLKTRAKLGYGRLEAVSVGYIGSKLPVVTPQLNFPEPMTNVMGSSSVRLSN